MKTPARLAADGDGDWWSCRRRDKVDRTRREAALRIGEDGKARGGRQVAQQGRSRSVAAAQRFGEERETTTIVSVFFFFVTIRPIVFCHTAERDM